MLILINILLGGGAVYILTDMSTWQSYCRHFKFRHLKMEIAAQCLEVPAMVPVHCTCTIHVCELTRYVLLVHCYGRQLSC